MCVHGESLGQDDIFQEFHCILDDLGFLLLHLEVILEKYVQDSVLVVIVEVLAFGESEDDVLVNDDKLVQHVTKDVIYDVLGCCKTQMA